MHRHYRRVCSDVLSVVALGWRRSTPSRASRWAEEPSINQQSDNHTLIESESAKNMYKLWHPVAFRWNPFGDPFSAYGKNSQRHLLVFSLFLFENCHLHGPIRECDVAPVVGDQTTPIGHENSNMDMHEKLFKLVSKLPTGFGTLENVLYSVRWADENCRATTEMIGATASSVIVSLNCGVANGTAGWTATTKSQNTYNVPCIHVWL